MKLFLLISMLLTDCMTVQDIIPPFDTPNKINETNYMKTPCIWDGAIVKKRPKVNNVLPNDIN